MIRKWTPESDEPKPGEASNVQQLRAWFERLPKMRARICQQQEHIASLRNAATTTTSGTSGAPGRSGTSDKVGRNSDAAMDAEQHLAELKCQYAEMQKEAIEVAYLILYYVEGKKQADIAPLVGYSGPEKVSHAISAGLHQLAEVVTELNLS